jgi:hypothetical protein
MFPFAISPTDAILKVGIPGKETFQTEQVTAMTHVRADLTAMHARSPSETFSFGYQSLQRAEAYVAIMSKEGELLCETSTLLAKAGVRATTECNRGPQENVFDSVPNSCMGSNGQRIGFAKVNACAFSMEKWTKAYQGCGHLGMVLRPYNMDPETLPFAKHDVAGFTKASMYNPRCDYEM